MKLHFTVSELSKILDISIHTLRYYDKIGLFHANGRGENQYRYYYVEQLDALITIKMFRAMNIPIQDIKEICSDTSLTRVRALLLQKHHEIEQERTRLKQTQQKLDFLEREFESFDHPDTIELVTAGPWYALLTDSLIESDGNAVSADIQNKLLSLGNDHSFLCLCHTLSIVSKENIEKSNYHSYLNNGLISPIKAPAAGFVTLNARYCARKCVVVPKNGYSALDHHYDDMKAFIAARNLKIDGNSIELNLYNQEQQHYIEIYIPVCE